ncbi:MAG: DUF6353 family protein [Neglectibacter sp.]
MQVYAHTGFQYIRLYAPAVLLGAASITCILTSHKLMRKRNMALAAAYATLTNTLRITAAVCWSGSASRWRRSALQYQGQGDRDHGGGREW